MRITVNVGVHYLTKKEYDALPFDEKGTDDGDTIWKKLETPDVGICFFKPDEEAK